ncbi:hypothetical protein LTR29_010939 [Friedmanniomyces endolithicus]|nr:hypothetical protein LTR29_010939 [Friedmanniomyces endolithicus]
MLCLARSSSLSAIPHPHPSYFNHFHAQTRLDRRRAYRNNQQSQPYHVEGYHHSRHAAMTSSKTHESIATRFLVLSDTHGELVQLPTEAVDVAIHCGDLTEESKLHEFRTSIALLTQINAPLKLVIAGNHDFALDLPMFKKKLADIPPPVDDAVVKREYGDFGEARSLLAKARDAGIVFLDEGTHSFTLANGAKLTVYASPNTPSKSDWGFSYDPDNGDHDWAIDSAVDVVITHGPPHGVLDYTHAKKRAGSPSLFAAVARARPWMHCFGHIHEGWGAKQVTWRETASEEPSHFTDIDNDASALVESLATIHPRKYDGEDDLARKKAKLEKLEQKRYCSADASLLGDNKTLFVNAAIKGDDAQTQQLPWIVSVPLPRADSRPPTPSSEKKRKAAAEVHEEDEQRRKRVALGKDL